MKNSEKLLKGIEDKSEGIVTTVPVLGRTKIKRLHPRRRVSTFDFKLTCIAIVLATIIACALIVYS